MEGIPTQEGTGILLATQEQEHKVRTRMSIFKRGRTYWFHFWFNSEHIQQSTRQGNPRIARQIEAAERTRLAKGEVGVRDRKPIPTFNVAMANFLASSATEHCA